VTSADELRGLLRQAEQLPYGGAQVALVEQVLRHADAAGDRELAFEARIFATTAYNYAGEMAKALVTFTRCLSEFDTQPAPFHARYAHQLLWYFKWMVSALTEFPEVPLARTYEVLDDMERRYREAGNRLQAVYKHRFVVARHVGDPDAAELWYQRWISAPRDRLSDCSGCDPSEQVGYLTSRGRDEEAIALAAPVLAGRVTCTEQPQFMLVELLTPYVRTGRLEAAADAHRRAYRAHRAHLADLESIGRHIEFCARTGNEHRGLEILQRHLDWLDRAPSPGAGMVFAACAALLLHRLGAVGHGDVTVHRPAHGDRPAADLPAAVLADDLTRYATRLAARFDARNGSTAEGDRVAALLVAEPYGVDLPLSASARRRGAPPIRPAPAFPAPDQVEVPAAADPAELLDLAERYSREDRDEAADAVLAQLDERVGAGPLPPLLAARRAELHGGRQWHAGDHAAAGTTWREGAELAAGAGDAGLTARLRSLAGLAACLGGAPEDGLPAVEANVAYQDRHGGPRERVSALSRLALALSATGAADAALGVLDRAERLLPEAGDDRVAARLALRRAQVLLALHRPGEAAAAADGARAYARRHGPAPFFVAASLLWANAASDASAAIAALDEVLAVGGPDAVLDARVARARRLMAADRPGDAIGDYVEAVALCTERGAEHGGAALRHELAVAYRDADRLAEAAEVAEEAVAAWERLGAGAARDDARFVLAGVYARLGDVDAALHGYDELLERQAGNPLGRGQLAAAAAEAAFRGDRDAEAAARFAVAADAYREAGAWQEELATLRRRVRALHWADDVPAMEEALAAAIARHAAAPAALAAEPPLVWERAMLGHEAARFLLHRDRPAEALRHVAPYPQRLRDIGATDDADRAEALHGEALLRTGERDAAVRLLEPLLARLAPDSPVRAGVEELLAEA
jgi:cellulose synthase operon protein C